LADGAVPFCNKLSRRPAPRWNTPRSPVPTIGPPALAPTRAIASGFVRKFTADFFPVTGKSALKYFNDPLASAFSVSNLHSFGNVAFFDVTLLFCLERTPPPTRAPFGPARAAPPHHRAASPPCLDFPHEVFPPFFAQKPEVPSLPHSPQRPLNADLRAFRGQKTRHPDPARPVFIFAKINLQGVPGGAGPHSTLCQRRPIRPIISSCMTRFIFFPMDRLPLIIENFGQPSPPSFELAPARFCVELNVVSCPKIPPVSTTGGLNCLSLQGFLRPRRVESWSRGANLSVFFFFAEVPTDCQPQIPRWFRPLACRSLGILLNGQQVNEMPNCPWAQRLNGAHRHPLEFAAPNVDTTLEARS